MYKLLIDLPNLTKGAEVQIDGLGIFKNGDEHEIDDDLAQNYRSHHSRVVDYLDEDEKVGSRVVQGPTLLEAFKSNDHITVEVAGKKKAAKSHTEAVDTELPPNEGSVN